MQKKRMIAASTLVVLLLIAGGVFVSAKALRRTNSEEKYLPYMEEDTEYDVMFFGTSHVLNSLLPMQLWKDYGITSYNFAGHANSITASYWELRLAATKHKPKIAVLDMFGIGWNTTSMKTEFAHLSFDVWPLSALKREAICDIFPEESDREELLFPYSIYHNRWSELTFSEMQENLSGKAAQTTQKGAELRYGVKTPAAMTLIPQDQKAQNHTIGQDYVVEFIEYCQASGIEPVLINVPAPGQDADHQEQANAAADIAAEYDVPYINMMYLDLVDYDTDSYDENSHLNPSGARKVTDYLGAWLKQHYDLPDHREDADYALWKDDYDAYHEDVAGQIRSLKKFKVMLMALNHSDFSGTLYLGSETETDDQTRKLIGQLGENLTVYEDADLTQNDGTERDGSEGNTQEAAAYDGDEPESAAALQADQARIDVYDRVEGEVCVSAIFDADGKRVQ